MWKLQIWNANRSQLLNTITDAGPWGVSGGFKWQRSGSGGCVQLDLSVINRVALLEPRSVVQLTVDDVPQFYGIVPDPPSIYSPDVESVQILGGREALRVALMDGAVYRKMGVYAIVRDIFARLLPPSLTGLSVPEGDGPVLDLYYAPTKQLDQVLDDLAKSAGATWGVNEWGRVFLTAPSTAAASISYAGRGWRRLRVQGREACTRAVVRVVSAPSATPNSYQGVTHANDYLPATITAIAESDQHGVYHAEQVFEAPAALGLIAVRAGALRTFAAISPEEAAKATDGDPTTFATLTSNSGQRASVAAALSPPGRGVGLRLRYALAQPGEHWYDNTVSLIYQVGDVSTAATWELRETQGPTDLTIVFPPDARMSARRALVDIASEGANVYEISILVIDEDAALKLAQSYLQAPYATPAEITLDGLLLPAPQVTVTGTPDGDVSGDAALWEYEHTPENPRTTRIRLGSDGQSDTARAIKWAVKNG